MHLTQVSWWCSVDTAVGVAEAAAGAVAPPGSKRREVALRAGMVCGDAAGATASIVSGVAGAAVEFAGDTF